MKASDLMEEIRGLSSRMIADRRYLHKNPELSGMEFRTTEFIRNRLEGLGIEIERLDIPTGVSALIRGAHPGRTVCVRHDIDALPIQEETGLPFASCVKGVSHSCGHDFHAVIAMYCAEVLPRHRDDLHGCVRVVFQPAEEDITGAKAMVAAGLMDLEPRHDVVVGLHTHPYTEAGNICLRKGPMEAGADFFTITVSGISGHGAYPHCCVDPILTSAYLLSQLQAVISRENQSVKPAVLTVGSIHGGDAPNVIPEKVVMRGSLRTLYSDSRKNCVEAIKRVTAQVCAGMRASGTVEFSGTGLPPLQNDGAVVDGIIEAADQMLGRGHVVEFPFPSMGSDDFSVFLDYSRGAQFFLGTKNSDPSSSLGLHRGGNVFDESALVTGTAVLSRFVMNYLG